MRCSQHGLKGLSWAGLGLGLLLLAGCAAPGAGRERVQPTQAEALYAEGEFQQAAVAWMDLARRDRQARASYRLRAAQAWREEGDWQSARDAMAEIRRRDLDRQESMLLDLLYAETALAEGDVQTASDLLLMDPDELPASLLPRLLELRARTFAAAGAWVDAARERVALDPLLAELDRADNARMIQELLARLPASERQHLLRRLERNDPLYAWLLRRTPIQREGAGSFAEELVVAPVLDANAQPLAPIQVPVAPARRLAVLLPLSGDLAAAAQVIRDGVLAGYYSDPERRPQVRLYDSGSTPASALAAYDLAVAEGADRVLGPFPRDQVTALFQRGTVVPTLALNYAEAPALPPPGSLQFALLPEEEAMAVAEFMAARGMQTVSALVPEDDFGRRALDAFRSRFGALGGQVVDAQFYNPQLNDNAGVVRRALSRQRTAVRTADGRVEGGLDGLFVTARPAQARMLLPQIRVLNPVALPIIATSHLYGGVPSPQDVDLEGVIFVDAPWLYEAVDHLPPRAQVAALPALQGPAVRLFAFGMDAWTLAARLAWLEDHPREVLVGATGLLAADGRGSIRRQGVWRQFRNGQPEPLE